MKRLWYKQCYVFPILSGEKTDTIRRSSCKIVAGDVVDFSVGPRTPFARAEILAREDVGLDELPDARAAQVTQIYNPTETFCRLRFRLISSTQ